MRDPKTSSKNEFETQMAQICASVVISFCARAHCESENFHGRGTSQFSRVHANLRPGRMDAHFDELLAPVAGRKPGPETGMSGSLK
jgi:hypothetical protein